MKGKKVCIRPMRMKIQSIQRLKPPSTPKGDTDVLQQLLTVSLFYPELQKLL